MSAHRRAIEVLQRGGIKPMVGGAYALRAHTGIWRDTKDLDLFLRKDQIDEALDLLAKDGYRTELTDPMWIGKAFSGDYFVDLIFSSGNGVATVDEHWQRRALHATVLGRQALIVPAEEMIWQKGYIQERERFDGADIHHLIRAKGPNPNCGKTSTGSAEICRTSFATLTPSPSPSRSHKDQCPPWVLRTRTA